MKLHALRVVCVLALAASACAQTGLEIPICRAGGNRFTGEGMRIPPVRPYAELGFMGVPKNELRDLLQAFVTARHGRSFRRLGDYKDFFHGHLLYTRDDAAPAAILYHTQEAAAVEHERNPGGPYDYIDELGRNWLQTPADGSLVNAATRARKTYPATPEWAEFKRTCIPQYVRAKTITPLMLDLAHAPGLTREIQFNFHATPCETLPKDEASNGLRLRLPDDSETCVLLGTNSL